MFLGGTWFLIRTVQTWDDAPPEPEYRVRDVAQAVVLEDDGSCTWRVTFNLRTNRRFDNRIVYVNVLNVIGSNEESYWNSPSRRANHVEDTPVEFVQPLTTCPEDVGHGLLVINFVADTVARRLELAF